MRKTEISRSLREIQRSVILKSFVYRRAEESLPGPESNGANFSRPMRKTEISRSLREIQRSEILLEILKSFVYRRAEESLPGPESNGANFYVVLTSSMCACA